MDQGMNTQPILQVQKVTKSFGGILALNQVSFDLHKGEILGIIGPNGSGKTTLVNCITGFIKMTSGQIFFQGRNISGKPAHKIADMGITRTFQIMRPYYSLAAYKNLVIPLFSPRAKRTGGWRGGGKLGDRNTVSIDILEEMGFERESFVPYKLASTLPTGYLKRLELARCLALKPEIILCDEVFSGLSMSEIASMVPLIERLQMEGITLVMIEHRLRELFRVANRVMVLNFGEKLIEGKAEEVMTDEKVKEAYFGSEQVEALNAVKTKSSECSGPTVPENLPSCIPFQES
jgi:branched-chain amino acid transport system ATP-binding protein